MENKTVIPKDIQDRADELYPKYNRSDFHTDTEYEGAVVYWANHVSPIKDAYIRGRMEERARFMTDILDAINHIDAIDSLNELSSQKQAFYMNKAIEKLKVSLDNLRKLL